MYSELSRVTAHDPELLRIAGHVRWPPLPNVFFAAVHFLLLESPTHELAAFYGSLTSNPRPPTETRDAFRDFVLLNSATLIPLLETRITQTNDVSRCSFLLPAFTHVYRLCGAQPLALIDVGCSACLHLRWEEAAMAGILVAFSTRRSIYWLHCEREEMLMRQLDRGQVSETRLANIDGHGRWLQWHNPDRYR